MEFYVSDQQKHCATELTQLQQQKQVKANLCVVCTELRVYHDFQSISESAQAH